jgi:hypothetical protein
MRFFLRHRNCSITASSYTRWYYTQSVNTFDRFFEKSFTLHEILSNPLMNDV